MTMDSQDFLKKFEPMTLQKRIEKEREETEKRRNAFREMAKENHAKMIAHLEEQGKIWAECVNQISSTLTNEKWPFPYHINIPQLKAFSNELLQIENETDLPEFIMDWMDRLYSERAIHRILMDWSNIPFLSRRFPILKAGVEAFLQGNYYTAIPTMLTQIEGLFASEYHLITEKKRMYTSDYKELVNKVVAGKDFYSEEEATKMFILNELFAHFELGESSDSKISRHAILHGEDTQYATRENGLKLIILLDNVIMFLDEFQMD